MGITSMAFPAKALAFDICLFVKNCPVVLLGIDAMLPGVMHGVARVSGGEGDAHQEPYMVRVHRVDVGFTIKTFVHDKVGLSMSIISSVSNVSMRVFKSIMLPGIARKFSGIWFISPFTINRLTCGSISPSL